MMSQTTFIWTLADTPPNEVRHRCCAKARSAASAALQGEVVRPCSSTDGRGVISTAAGPGHHPKSREQLARNRIPKSCPGCSCQELHNLRKVADKYLLPVASAKALHT